MNPHRQPERARRPMSGPTRVAARPTATLERPVRSSDAASMRVTPKRRPPRARGSPSVPPAGRRRRPPCRRRRHRVTGDPELLDEQGQAGHEHMIVTWKRAISTSIPSVSRWRRRSPRRTDAAAGARLRLRLGLVDDEAACGAVSSASAPTPKKSGRMPTRSASRPPGRDRRGAGGAGALQHRQRVTHAPLGVSAEIRARRRGRRRSRRPGRRARRAARWRAGEAHATVPDDARTERTTSACDRRGPRRRPDGCRDTHQERRRSRAPVQYLSATRSLTPIC